MTGRIITTVLTLFCAVMLATAQNRIDKMAEDFSSVGSGKFTSVIERNPNSRKIEKVVKELEINNTRQISEFISAFKKEADSGDYSEKSDGHSYILMLTTSSPRHNRIYMIRCEQPLNPHSRNMRYAYAKVTIIIRYK